MMSKTYNIVMTKNIYSILCSCIDNVVMEGFEYND